MDPLVDLGGADLVARLARWVAEAAVDEAAAARSRERWLRRAAGEEATFAGVLLDLAERGSTVVVTGRAGRRHRGTVGAVGHDFAALRLSGASDVLVAFAGVASVRASRRSEPAVGDRPVAIDVGLAEALAAVADDRPRVLIVTTVDADGLAGDLLAVGRDVLTLRLEGADRAPAYVPMATLAELRLA